MSPFHQAFMDAISLQEVALTLLKNLGSSSRSARDRGGKPDNHSEAAAFGPSSGKFKPRKFAKTDSTIHHASVSTVTAVVGSVTGRPYNDEIAMNCLYTPPTACTNHTSAASTTDTSRASPNTLTPSKQRSHTCLEILQYFP
ncbi:hypothetical protein E2C01_010189 [Portunus trituberculatus]|uniref:Uncharacterized protein n=1 Tax=Portunus trituberculatus TaxID=210409 RepID=A0A5B7D7S7_PORTR|nr:hypothetical protein [Portunus trituberculatus]